MNSIISWIGGKKALRKIIYHRFPRKYRRYIEVFGGAGWVMFGKHPESRSNDEVYNDFNSNLTNLFRVVRDQPLGFIQKLGFLPVHSREVFEELKKIVQMQVNPNHYLPDEVERIKVYFDPLQAEELIALWNKRTSEQDIDLAVAFFKQVQYSYASGTTSYSGKGYDVRRVMHQVIRLSERIKDTVIENKDFEALIRQYDRTDAFFYCDPPYYMTEGHYQVEFTKEDHTRLRDTLANIKGKFLLSYNDCEYIRELYKDFNIEKVKRLNNMAQRYEGGSEYEEVIISNYGEDEQVQMGLQMDLFNEMEEMEDEDESTN